MGDTVERMQVNLSLRTIFPFGLGELRFKALVAHRSRLAASTVASAATDEGSATSSGSRANLVASYGAASPSTLRALPRLTLPKALFKLETRCTA